MGKLSGKYAVVTGGSRGIGRATVELFLAEDAAGVAVFGRNPDNLKKLAAELDDTRLLPVQCDVADGDRVKTAFAEVCAVFPRIDVLINNASITRDKMLHKSTLENWDAVMDTNLRGTYMCMMQVIPGMRERCYGKIVNFSSAAIFGNPGQTNYAASKAGIIGLTITAAKELGRKNITVNCVSPGTIETDMFATVPREIVEGWEKNLIALGRLGRPEECAKAILFLACDDSSYITGATLMVNGGGTISI